MEDEIPLGIGDSYELSLPGLGTAGYTWSSTTAPPGVVRVDALPPNAEPAVRLVGASKDERFALVGLRAGSAAVTFRLARSFEPQKPPQDTRTFHVVVR